MADRATPLPHSMTPRSSPFIAPCIPTRAYKVPAGLIGGGAGSGQLPSFSPIHNPAMPPMPLNNTDE
jgi:hypothetical protein